MEILTKVKRKIDIFVTKFININKKSEIPLHFMPKAKEWHFPHSGEESQNIHKLFTQKGVFPLDFSPGIGYAMLALKVIEC